MAILTKTAQNNLWYKQKRPVIDEYLSTHKQVEDMIAGKGHLYRPGYLGRMTTDVERTAKFALSDINYNITKEAIERQLAQLIYEYSEIYSEAIVLWETSKASILGELELDYMGTKSTRDLDQQELDRLIITTNLRQLIVMAAKTAIEEDMERYRQEMTTVDQSTFPAENALLNAKLLTAQKKLEVIPYIEVVLGKQQEIIDAETNNAEKKEALIEKKEELVEERQELIEAYEGLNEKMVELIEAKDAVVTAREDLITAKESLADAKLLNIPLMDTYIESLEELNSTKQEIATAKKENLPHMAAYIEALGELDTAKENLAAAKLKNLPYMDTYIEAVEELSQAKQEIADAKLLNLPYITNHMAKLEELIASKELLATAKLENIPHMEQYMAAIEELITAHGQVIIAKENLLPKLNEKAAAQTAYAAELRTWILVKQIIAGVKEEIAEQMVERADNKGAVMDARIVLGTNELALQEAKINLEIARMTGKTNLMNQNIGNASFMLTEQEESLNATVERDGELQDAQISFDLYGEDQSYQSMAEINNYVIPKEISSISRIAAARILKERDISNIQAGAELTSKLVHLLS